MPLDTDLPTNKADGDPGHSAGHNNTNTRINEVATAVNLLPTTAAVASAIATHAAATDPHGDRSAAAAALAAHEADTTSVHGIADTAALLTTSAAAAAYQPLDADLTAIAGLTATTDNFLQAKASAWASRTPAQVKTDLGLPSNASSDLDAIRAQIFGGAARTQKPMVVLSLAANKTIPSGGSDTLLGASDWTVDKDTDSIWSSSLLTIPITGFYKVIFFGFWQPNPNGTRWLEVFLNGTSGLSNALGVNVVPGVTGGNDTGHSIVLNRQFTAGDVLRTYVYQDSGDALSLWKNRYGNVTTAFSLEWMRPA